MDDLEKYRAKINRRYRDRRTPNRYIEGGRRTKDYRAPPFFTWECVVQFLVVAGVGLVLFASVGCAVVKRTLSGG